MDERRSNFRQLTCIPAHIELDDQSPSVALIRDASVTGAKLLTRVKLEPGEIVHLKLYIATDPSTARPAEGKVVRAERRSADRADMWQWETGVEFDSPITEYESEIQELIKRQEAAGVLKV